MKISVEEDVSVYAVLGTNDFGLKDPRHSDMGYRTFEKPNNLEEKTFDVWDRLRISLTIPDGSRDMEVEKSTLLVRTAKAISIPIIISIDMFALLSILFLFLKNRKNTSSVDIVVM